MSMANATRSVSEIIQDILGNTREIIRSEIQLAAVEMKQEARKTGRAVTIIAGGMVMALYGGALILLAAVYGLNLFLPPWLSALLMGFLLAVYAYVLISSGMKRLRQVDPKPARAAETAKETIQWAIHRNT
jgi:hypothetical protein